VYFLSNSATVLGAFTELRGATIRFVVSVRPSTHWNNSAPTGRIFTKFVIRICLNLSRKLWFYENLTIITATLGEDVCIVIRIYCCILTRLNGVLGRVIEKIKMHILCSITHFSTIMLFMRYFVK